MKFFLDNTETKATVVPMKEQCSINAPLDAVRLTESVRGAG